MHQEKSPLAGQVVVIKDDVDGIGGKKMLVEDWWDMVSGQSWRDCTGNPACLNYALRIGFVISIDPSKMNMLDDPKCYDEVVYGKVGSFGHLVHISELMI